MRLAALILMAANPVVAAPAAEPPSAEAIALAEAMLPSDAASAQDEQAAVAALVQILGSPLFAAIQTGGCDRAVPACRDAARRIATEQTPALMELTRRVAVLSYAFRLDRDLSAAQIVAATAFFRTEAGGALAHSLSIQGKRAGDADNHAKDRARAEQIVDTRGWFLKLQEQFRAQTADLPRQKGSIDPDFLTQPGLKQ